MTTPGHNPEAALEIPFEQFILKVHSRCNLACTYCYVYESADQSWRTQDKTMSEHTLTQTAMRIGEHAAQFGLRRVAAILHGGEPLLIRPEGIAHTATTLRSHMPEGTRLKLSVQTNGTLLNPEMLNALRQHKIGVGVSLDGTQEANDEFRVYHNGRGSYGDVANGLRLLQNDYPDIYGGILCTINPQSDPLQTYESLASFSPRIIDFLLPHHNWSDLPPARDPNNPTPYADWLIPIFERWAPDPPMDIRMFTSILMLLMNRPSRVETLGLEPSTLVVVNTNGGIEQVDSLSSTYEGAAGTGLNVFDNSFREALAHPAIKARQLGKAALSTTCQECVYLKVCGGGYYPHRWRKENGFDNPSVYCADLMKIIEYIYISAKSGRLNQT